MYSCIFFFYFEEHGGSVYDVFECQDGSILSAGLDTRMLKWKKDSGEILVGCDGHSFAVNQCIECVDGSKIKSYVSEKIQRWCTFSEFLCLNITLLPFEDFFSNEYNFFFYWTPIEIETICYAPFDTF